MAGATQCKAEHRGIDVHTVHDEAVPSSGRLQRLRDGARFPARQRPHGIEQMRETREPFRHGGTGLQVECPSDTRMPAATSRAMNPGGTTSGAKVTSKTPWRGAVRIARSSGHGRLM